MFAQWGGKRALATRALDSVRISLTSDARFVAPVDRPVERLVFVCAGNICRSPFAEVLARKLGATSISMGLRATANSLAHPAAVSHAKRHGVDLQAHRASPFDTTRICPGDLVLGFELWHVRCIELAAVSGAVRLLGSFLGPSHYHIHDPYGLADTYFDRCFDTITSAVERIVRSRGINAE